MSVQYAYFYAVIELDTGWCYQVKDTTDYYDPADYPDYIPIPEYSRVYLNKYYNQADGKWYTDAAFTNEATELNG